MRPELSVPAPETTRPQLKRLRISIVIGTLGFGGTERQVVLLSKMLRSIGHQPSVIVYKRLDEMEPELERAGVGVRSLGGGGGHPTRTLTALARVLRSERPDVVYALLPHATVPVALMAPWLRPSRVVLGVRASQLEKSHQYGWEIRCLLSVEGTASRMVDAVICNSEAGLHDALRRRFPPQKLSVVPNGVDTQRFRPDPAVRRDFRRQVGAGEEDLLVGNIGRLHPGKDHLTFFRAARRLAGSLDGGHFRFICVGAGKPDYSENVRRHAAELGLKPPLLTFLDTRRDVEVVHQGLDLLVSTSLSEGMPNVLLEAMACGVPCVATDVGDAAVVVHPTACQVVPAGDPDAVAEACCRVLSDFGPETPQALRQHVERRFSADVMTRRTLGLMSGLLEAAPDQPAGGRNDSGK